MHLSVYPSIYPIHAHLYIAKMARLNVSRRGNSKGEEEYKRGCYENRSIGSFCCSVDGSFFFFLVQDFFSTLFFLVLLLCSFLLVKTTKSPLSFLSFTKEEVQQLFLCFRNEDSDSFSTLSQQRLHFLRAPASFTGFAVDNKRR